MTDSIKIIGAKQHNLKNISINIPKNKLLFLQVYQEAVNLHWLLILSMQRDKDDMSKVCPPMPANSWE